tara:strand:+ start:279 stop:914 length:636 start_codon:yes stop_codon:yes gene_type:complete
MPYFHKRAAMSENCMLDQPVPLSYYSGLPVRGLYQPSTIRDLVNLKTKEYILEGEMTERKVMDFVSSFSKRLINLASIERLNEFPDSINEEVNNMTDDELNKAFDDLTVEAAEEVLEETPLTLTEQQELGDIIIPAIEDVVARPTATRTGTSRYEKPEPEEPEMMDDLLSGATTGPAETPRGGGSSDPFPSFTSRGERAMMRDITRSRGDY